MAYRRRGTFRRRKSFLRWFTPNLWNASNPQLYSQFIGNGANEQTSEVALTNLCFGSAPFPGVVNPAGIRAGVMLAERQYFSIRRVVGRMRWFLEQDDDVIPMQRTIITVWWAIVRMNTDENGQPDAQALGNFPSLSIRDNQDDKKMILAQDVWRTVVPPGGPSLPDGKLFELEAEPPLFSMVDKTMKRSFRNEQDIFLATQFGVFWGDTIPASGTEVNLKGLLNLRMLGAFGR